MKQDSEEYRTYVRNKMQDVHGTKERNTDIRELYHNGVSMPIIARKYGIHRSRVHQIIKAGRK